MKTFNTIFFRRTVFQALLPSLFLFQSSASAQQAEYLELLPPAPHNQGMYCYALSTDGTTVVGTAGFFEPALTPYPRQLAFRWHKNTGFVNPAPGQPWLRASATVISPDGGTMAGAYDPVPDIRVHPWLWTSATGLVNFLPGNAAIVKAVTDKAENILYLTTNSSCVRQNHSSGNVVIPAASALGYPYFSATDMSHDGKVIVGSVQPSHGWYKTDRPAIWREGIGTTLIPVPPGLRVGDLNAVSGDGTTAIGAFFDNQYTHAYGFRWTAQTGAVGFGPLGAFVPDTYPCGVSDDGLTVGIASVPALVWNASLGLYDLKQRLVQLGASIPPSGVTGELYLTAVSGDGNAFAGTRDYSYPSDDRIWIAYLEAPQGSVLGDAYCTPGNVNSTGNSASLVARGSIVASDNEVHLTSTGLPNNAFGLLLAGTQQGFVANAGGSQGNLCLGGSVGRYNHVLGNSGTSGEIRFDLDLFQTPTPTGTTAISAGQTWYFQCWYRDQNPGATSNFSEATAIAFQ